MEYDPKNKLSVGTRVILTKDIPENKAFSGMVGTVAGNDIFEYTYMLMMDSLDRSLPVYACEIEIYDELTIPDQLSVL